MICSCQDSFDLNGFKPTVLMAHNHYRHYGGEDSVFYQEKELLEIWGCTVIPYERSNEDLELLINKATLPFAMLFNLRTFLDVRRIIASFGVDIVHCHNTFPLISPSVYWAAHSLGVPVFQTVHNFRLICPGALLFREGSICDKCICGGLHISVKRGCYRESRMLTALAACTLAFNRMIGSYSLPEFFFLTEFNRKQHTRFLRAIGAKSAVKPNCCSIQGAEAKPLPERNKRFVCFGRLSKEKGIDKLVATWVNYCDGLGIELLIAGSGEYEDEVRRLSMECRSLRYAGMLTHDELMREVSTSIATIVPSLWYEGFPMAIAESFSYGTPVLASAIGNCAEIVRGSNAGATFDPMRPLSFLDSISELLTKWELYSNNATRYSRAELSSQRTIAELLSSYYRAIDESDRGDS